MKHPYLTVKETRGKDKRKRMNPSKCVAWPMVTRCEYDEQMSGCILNMCGQADLCMKKKNKVKNKGE